MKNKRPVYLDLTRISFPCPAIVSILHRISGVMLFLLLPLLLWLLSQSLSSQHSFEQLHQTLTHPLLRFFFWVTLSALIFHLIAGIRHLLMDVGIGETLGGGRLGAYLVMCISAVFIILLGIWLW